MRKPQPDGSVPPRSAASWQIKSNPRCAAATAASRSTDSWRPPPPRRRVPQIGRAGPVDVSAGPPGAAAQPDGPAGPSTTSAAPAAAAPLASKPREGTAVPTPLPRKRCATGSCPPKGSRSTPEQRWGKQACPSGRGRAPDPGDPSGNPVPSDGGRATGPPRVNSKTRVRRSAARPRPTGPSAQQTRPPPLPARRARARPPTVPGQPAKRRAGGRQPGQGILHGARPSRPAPRRCALPHVPPQGDVARAARRPTYGGGRRRQPPHRRLQRRRWRQTAGNRARKIRPNCSPLGGSRGGRPKHTPKIPANSSPERLGSVLGATWAQKSGLDQLPSRLAESRPKFGPILMNIGRIRVWGGQNCANNTSRTLRERFVTIFGVSFGRPPSEPLGGGAIWEYVLAHFPSNLGEQFSNMLSASFCLLLIFLVVFEIMAFMDLSGLRPPPWLAFDDKSAWARAPGPSPLG